MAGLLDYLKEQKDAAMNDYRGLMDNYPNAQKFARSLLGNIEKNIPSNADLRSPEKMGEWSLSAALNAPTMAAIKAYHGSPHKFDKFDMSKIGTGEGAQAYGHGLYMAENPAVAKDYQENISFMKGVRPSDIEIDGKYYTIRKSDTHKSVYDFIKNKLGDSSVFGIDAATAGRLLKENKGNVESAMSASDGRVKEYLNLFKGHEVTTPEGIGHLYKTSLEWPDAAREAADPMGPQHFLDWDKPLSEQSAKVIEALHKLKNNAPEGGIYRESLQPIENTTGSGLHRAYENDLAMEGNGQPGKTFSMLLNEYGVPGIRYLDQGSRGAGNGSYNYVVFDDQIPKIIERNGKKLNGLLGD